MRVKIKPDRSRRPCQAFIVSMQDLIEEEMRRVLRFALRVIAIIAVVLIAGAALRALSIAGTPQTQFVDVQTLADPDGRFIDVNGARLYVRERGPQAGKPVILVHGFLLETSSFEPLIDALAQRGFRVIAFDRPPFGLSDKSPALDYGLNAQGDWVIGLMDAFGIQQAALVGHSAGARTVANAATRYPQRVRKLVMIGPQFVNQSNATDNPGAGPILTLVLQGLNPFHDWARAEIRAFFADERVREFAQTNLAEPSVLSEARLQQAARFRQVAGWDEGLLAFGTTLTRNTGGPGLAGLSQVTMPTLLLWGEGDRLVPVAGAGMVAAALPNARLITYAGCDHIPWEGCASTLVDDLSMFLQQ
jgi:pimeloyl-ACP methyl ester carboxylesterase